MVILRKKIRNKFVYHYSNGKKIIDKKIIEKINKLRMPPAYTDVKIFPNARKIMATGLDIAGRKQYIYNQEYLYLHYLDIRVSPVAHCQFIILGFYELKARFVNH